ncbi:hypothetical protein MUU72_34825 [Streptomyces sp. RS10V-4]|uniref:hypothetical protein n=1 Tax=Streptomyces rhizoryzae TaxID=2932493 RepID=UPI002003A241|nr:hypothetical protein [Streptomyces rhizoryzae]MCK7628200.1 hypothetical protein [Streptomyces rhizoryzae]
MPTKILRSSWTAGPASGAPGPVLVSLTDFTPRRLTDLPGIYRAARRLSSRWRELEGAHGMWLWAERTGRRCGAVAVWRDHAALRGFVGWPPHVEIMRAYRGRGALTSTTWTTDTFTPATLWTRAQARLTATTPPHPDRDDDRDGTPR